MTSPTDTPEIPKAPLLSQLFGVDEARLWGENLAMDLDAYKHGELDWSEIEAGAVLHGPAGTGKTTLARAIAATCRVPFIPTSYAAWSRGNSYGIEVMNAILATFDKARANAPCIVAIDEIDSIPSRSSIPDGHHSTYKIVNTLLDQLDGDSRRKGVVVIGTCNSADRLDPALVRAGRLGRFIEVPLPPLDALTGIIRYHLAEDAEEFGDLSSIAVMCAGMSGASVEQVVREARGIARRAKRPFVRQDLVKALQSRTQARAPETDWRIALHEAGHAVACRHFNPTAEISLSIVPNGETEGRYNYSVGHKMPLTRNNLSKRLIVMLAGRAAEEVFLGDVSSGAGGASHSDLAKASTLALDAVASYGLAGSNRLFWHHPAGNPPSSALPALRQEAEKIVQEAYADALALIGQEWDFVHLTALALVKERALSHPQFMLCDRRPKYA